MICIEIANRVAIPVEFYLNNAEGQAEKQTLTLVCKRLGVAELDERIKEQGASLADFLAGVAEGWTGVVDPMGEAVPFTEPALRTLLSRYANLAGIAFSSYVRNQGAKEKN